MEISPFKAQMASVVQSIANRVNHTSQSPGKPHVENNSQKLGQASLLGVKKELPRIWLL